MVGLFTGTTLCWFLVGANPIGMNVGALTTPRSLTIHPGAASTLSSTTTQASGQYYLALGDSLAYGYQPNSVPATQGYVNDTYLAEQANFPGLSLENLGCPGETTTSLISGGICAYSTGNQLAQAESFLSANPGKVAFITLDIGANDVDGCIGSSGIDLNCFQSGLKTVASNLPKILEGLRSSAGPSVPIIGVNYYDSFLGLWVTGAAGQSFAKQSLVGLEILNGTIDNIFGSNGDLVSDTASAFDTNVVSTTDTYNGQTVPVDVYNVCTLTWMCSQGNIHANTAGYKVMADRLETTISQALGSTGINQPSGWLITGAGQVLGIDQTPTYGDLTSIAHNGPVVSIASSVDHAGYWLAGYHGGVFAFGDAHFYGSGSDINLAGPVVAIAPSGDGNGYWLVTSLGGVYSFGDAGFFGSQAGLPMWGTVASFEPTPDGNGYWMVTTLGEVITFGDAQNYGSDLGAIVGTVTGFACTPDGNGYWFITSAGYVYSFGQATYHGGPGPGVQNGTPEIYAIDASYYQGGYWAVTSQGNPVAYGPAPKLMAVQIPLQTPLVGAMLF